MSVRSRLAYLKLLLRAMQDRSSASSGARIPGSRRSIARPSRKDHEIEPSVTLSRLRLGGASESRATTDSRYEGRSWPHSRGSIAMEPTTASSSRRGREYATGSNWCRPVSNLRFTRRSTRRLGSFSQRRMVPAGSSHRWRMRLRGWGDRTPLRVKEKTRGAMSALASRISMRLSIRGCVGCV